MQPLTKKDAIVGAEDPEMERAKRLLVNAEFRSRGYLLSSNLPLSLDLGEDNCSHILESFGTYDSIERLPTHPEQQLFEEAIKRFTELNGGICYPITLRIVVTDVDNVEHNAGVAGQLPRRIYIREKAFDFLNKPLTIALLVHEIAHANGLVHLAKIPAEGWPQRELDDGTAYISRSGWRHHTARLNSLYPKSHFCLFEEVAAEIFARRSLRLDGCIKLRYVETQVTRPSDEDPQRMDLLRIAGGLNELLAKVDKNWSEYFNFDGSNLSLIIKIASSTFASKDEEYMMSTDYSSYYACIKDLARQIYPELGGAVIRFNQEIVAVQQGKLKPKDVLGNIKKALGTGGVKFLANVSPYDNCDLMPLFMYNLAAKLGENDKHMIRSGIEEVMTRPERYDKAIAALYNQDKAPDKHFWDWYLRSRSMSKEISVAQKGYYNRKVKGDATL